MEMRTSIPEGLTPAYPAGLPNEKVRAKLMELLGLEEPPAKVDYETGEAEETSDRLRITRLRYENCLGETVPAILTVPADAKPLSVAGIVCVPGTGGDAERVTHPGFYREQADTGPLFGWGRELARRGFATLSITAKGTEARHDTEDDWNIECKLLAPYGRSQMGVLAGETIRAARVLESTEQVDGRRIGLTGMSLGGNATWYAMACAPWIAAGVPICGGVGSLADVIHHGDPMRASAYFYIPHMLRYFDHPRIVATCIAPRPFMVIGPTKDEDMPRSGVDKLIKVVRPAYEAAGRPDCFKVHQPESRHVFRTVYFEWMAQWFRRFLSD